jgi:hypothetical protein
LSANILAPVDSLANIWLRRQIFGSVGKLAFCNSSFGKYLAPLANLAFAAAPPANNWLRRQIWLLRQLCWQIFGSRGYIGNHLAPAENLASPQLSQQIFGFVSKYLAPLANIWLRWQIWLLWQLRRQIFGSSGSVGNNLAPSASLASRQLSPQIFGSVCK